MTKPQVPMNLNIFIFGSRNKKVQRWFQRLADRLSQGECRYGPGSAHQKYHTRLKLEMRAYNKTGNEEHLLNIANYCFLEANFPEHKKHHYDPYVDSATRGLVNKK